MKAILVIDINEKYIGSFGTRIQFMNREYDCNWKLKPMPQKMKHKDEIDYEYGYIDGRNDLIDEITGEIE